MFDEVRVADPQAVLAGEPQGRRQRGKLLSHGDLARRIHSRILRG
jgi:hypothetical protein